MAAGAEELENKKEEDMNLSGGGTGMSPWRMMQEWGIPTFYLQSMAYECA